MLVGCEGRKRDTCCHGIDCCDTIESRYSDEEMIYQYNKNYGDPFVVIAGDHAMLYEGADEELLERAGITITRKNEIVIATDADTSITIPFIYGSKMEMLFDYAIQMFDSGDPIEIKYRYSSCIEAVTCLEGCRRVGLHFYAKETPIREPKRCKRVTEDKICTDKMLPTCSRQLFYDDACTKPVKGPMKVDKWRCN
jgi:hypothetical protein